LILSATGKNPGNKKSILQQVMKPSDWIKLSVLLIISVGCWIWVWQVYSQPFDYQDIINNHLNNTSQDSIDKN